jgi:DNA polymerase elongation subunit (family B)
VRDEEKEFRTGKTYLNFPSCKIIFDDILRATNCTSCAMKHQLLDVRVVWDEVVPRCVRVWCRSETGEATTLDFAYNQHFWVSGEWPGVFRANQLAGKQNIKCFCRKRCGKDSPYSKPWPCLRKVDLDACVIDEDEEYKTPFVGYHAAPVKMTKVSVCAPWAVRFVEKALRRSDPELVFYETHISPEQRFMIDNSMSGCCWIDESGVCEPPAAAIAPLVILSLDIECCSRSGEFPTPKKDPVITVAFVVSVYGREEREYATFQLGGATDWEDAHGELHTFTDEVQMLEASYAFMRQSKADLIAGYNSDHFDLPYLIERCRVLKCPRAFMYNLKNPLGSCSWHLATVKRHSAQMGEREVAMHSLVGTTTFDVMDIIRDNHKLRSYGLNAVAKHFLGDQKDDVKYSEIPALMRTSAGRGKLARYCQQDTILVADLIVKLHLVTNAVEFAKVTGATLDACLHRGQSVKVEANILKTTAPLNVVLQSFNRPYGQEEVFVPLYAKIQGAVSGGQGKTGFKGATVLDPIKGYYTTPVAVLDFASLYPSIIRAYNLSHDTILASEAEANRLGVAYNLTPEGTVFVKASVKEGILPLVCKTLLDARKQAKKQMKEADTAFDKAVFNGKQASVIRALANLVQSHTTASPARAQNRVQQRVRLVRRQDRANPVRPRLRRHDLVRPLHDRRHRGLRAPKLRRRGCVRRHGLGLRQLPPRRYRAHVAARRGHGEED